MEKSKREADGYVFRSDADAELAEQEKKKIEYLRAHINTGSPENMLQIYKKLLSQKIFRTPVGYRYLKEMQEKLLLSKAINPEDVPPVTLYQTFGAAMRDSYASPKVKSHDEEKKSPVKLISLILNAALIIAVIAMFVITMNSSNPNILNYETAIVNKYASWEQQLTERERAVRVKEKELNIQENSD